MALSSVFALNCMIHKYSRISNLAGVVTYHYKRRISAKISRMSFAIYILYDCTIKHAAMLNDIHAKHLTLKN